MLTLPSNMFYTVILPATLWFFDKSKDDDRILFIDARNIFTQIDRAHREFSEEQIQNIAIISQLHKGRRDKFIWLIDNYFEAGMGRLIISKGKVAPVCQQLLSVLDDDAGKQAVAKLVKQWAGLTKLQSRYEQYSKEYSREKSIVQKNKAQRQLREVFDPFFTALHDGLKSLDKVVRQHEKLQTEQAQADGKRGGSDRKTKDLKAALEALHREVKNAETYYQHIHWLQERFPKAEYEDVIGLCKLAGPADLKEQDYSLNPGRYVGVVIEEDGKTEEEFINDIVFFGNEISSLATESRKLEKVVAQNIKLLTGEE